MALVGKSLDKLIAERPSRRFSPGTAIGISIQMVNALRALHQIGYLHRDIKPANTTIGRPEDGETRVIYLLDFGMARRYTRPDVSRNDCFCAKPAFPFCRALIAGPVQAQISEAHHATQPSPHISTASTAARTTLNLGKIGGQTRKILIPPNSSRFYMMVEVYKGSLPWSNIGDMNQVGWSVNAFWSLELMSLIFRSETTRNVDSPTSLLMCDAKL